MERQRKEAEKVTKRKVTMVQKRASKKRHKENREKQK